MSSRFIGSVKYAAVAAWAATTAYTVGQIVRQLATPSVGNERCFVCIAAGTSGGSEPSWGLTKGAKTTDNTATWQEITGLPSMNAYKTGADFWAAYTSLAVSLGQIVKDATGTNYFICTTAGTASGSEPSWNTTAGATTTDNTVTWTCLGLCSAFTTSFGAPHARLNNAFASGFSAAGDDFYVSDTHSATQTANLTMVCPGTPAAPSRIMCITAASAASPVLSTGGQEKVTSTSQWRMGGCFYMYGLTLDNGASFVNWSGANSQVNQMVFDNCAIKQSNAAGANGLTMFFPGFASSTPIGSYAEFVNCAFTFAATVNTVGAYFGRVKIRNCTFAASGTVPTALFAANAGGILEVRDCDLSNINTALATLSSLNGGRIDIQNCKLHASVSATTGTSGGAACNNVNVDNCDSSGTNYKFNRSGYNGTITPDITNIRTSVGGFTDGYTPQSVKVVTSANNSFMFPLELPEMPDWNDNSGSSKTATVEIASDVTLTDADIWMTVEYLGDASSPKGSIVSSRMSSIIGIPTNLASSSETWGGSTTTKQKMSVTFTPQQKGLIKTRVFVAKKSLTVYVDPVATIS